MVLILSKRSLLTLLPYFLPTQATVSGDASGSGVTTRYWDCCKTSCAWSGKTTLASGASPVGTCSIDDTPLSDDNAASGCGGGSAYMCSDNSPWAVSADLAYGYAAVNIAGGSEESWCCACYELTFTSTAIAGKKMIVQAINTGGDLGSNQFDLAIPGGGVGIFNGCTTQWGAPKSGWGAQYGGISSASACATFPANLQSGCDWRYDWFAGADNPSVDFVQVECPAALTQKTGCVRGGEAPTGPSSVSTYVGGSSPASSSVSPAQSSSAASARPTSSSIPIHTTRTPPAPPSFPSTGSSAPIAVISSQAASASLPPVPESNTSSSTTATPATIPSQTPSAPPYPPPSASGGERPPGTAVSPRWSRSKKTSLHMVTVTATQPSSDSGATGDAWHHCGA